MLKILSLFAHYEIDAFCRLLHNLYVHCCWCTVENTCRCDNCGAMRCVINCSLAVHAIYIGPIFVGFRLFTWAFFSI